VRDVFSYYQEEKNIYGTGDLEIFWKLELLIKAGYFTKWRV